MKNCAELLDKIKDAKKKLFYLWEDKGFTDNEVLKAADDLDNLLNEYNHLLIKPNMHTSKP